MKGFFFTGHRPNKLGGYSKVKGDEAYRIQHAISIKLEQVIQRAVKAGFDTFIVGGALGIDQMAARAAINVREESLIQIILARPFPKMEAKWPKLSQEYFLWLQDQMDQVIDVSEGPYAPHKMMTRNKWMVDHSEAGCGVYNGTGGGTDNCINYTQLCNKPLLHVHPFTLEEQWI